MISSRLGSRAQVVKSQKDTAARKFAWPTYLGITALLLLLVVALAGGIVWYNVLKTTELMVATAERLMDRARRKDLGAYRAAVRSAVRDRPIASRVLEMKAPLHNDGHTGVPMLLRRCGFNPRGEAVQRR
jgi:hypothetical protein